MNSPSPKKLKLRNFALVSHFNESITMKKEKENKEDVQETNNDYSNEITTLSIDKEDEVWIVQCPLSFEPASLVGETLNFSRTCTITDFTASKQHEVLVNSSSNKFQCIIQKESYIGFEIRTLNVNGMLIVSENTKQGAQINNQDIMESFIHPPSVKLRNPHLLLPVDSIQK
ncbi:uncharacterized protein LOC103505906 [Diaphorina citri]|uniref:Uncharacterized protein LOC103505906 n=1 Tax=Diaphorina citri TaxID=121845 RepID=A0A1S3CV87_DIACI|nr:uncharacterized protein LOC103505906 [Diaphorina citri]KAI5750245.1 hypothetical protein M8J76_014040 [Diaphorina citri]KAI5754256.1 hypothetical protein M8J77_007173 [Diaphorina citri]